MFKLQPLLLNTALFLTYPSVSSHLHSSPCYQPTLKCGVLLLPQHHNHFFAMNLFFVTGLGDSLRRRIKLRSWGCRFNCQRSRWHCRHWQFCGWCCIWWRRSSADSSRRDVRAPFLILHTLKPPVLHLTALPCTLRLLMLQYGFMRSTATLAAHTSSPSLVVTRMKSLAWLCSPTIVYFEHRFSV